MGIGRIVSRLIAFCAVIFFVLQVSAGSASASIQKKKHKAVKHSKLLKAKKKKSAKKVHAKAKKKRKKNLQALRRRGKKSGRKLASVKNAEAEPVMQEQKAPVQQAQAQKREYTAADGEEFFPQNAQNDSGLLNAGLPDAAPTESLPEGGKASASNEEGLGESALE